MIRDRLSIALFLAIAILTVTRALTGLAEAALAAIGCVLALLVIEYARMAPLQRIVGSVLMVGGGVAASFAADPVATILLGLEKTLPFLLLFVSVAWLQVPAGESPALLSIRETVLRQPPGRRFAWVAGAGHFLGVAFNLAGLSLLTPMIARKVAPMLQMRLGRAMVQGFGAGTCWSPLYVGTAVIIASVPGVAWIEVGPVGFLIALVLIAWSWAFDRIFVRGGESAAEPIEESLSPPGSVWARLALILGSLFGCIIGLVEGLGWSIPIALAVVAPIYALIWAVLIGKRGASGTAGAVLSGLPGLRGEAILFTGANLLGVGIAALIPDLQGNGPIDLPPALTLFAIMAGYALASAAGLHPVVTVVLITSVLTPETIGVSPALLALALMVMWGQGTNISPFSATALYLARVTGRSGWAIAWRWNGAFGVTATLLLAGIIMALFHLGFG